MDQRSAYNRHVAEGAQSGERKACRARVPTSARGCTAQDGFSARSGHGSVRGAGVDAPIREIADRARVGIGTVYRHFPERSDLIKAVFQSQVDACADAAPDLAARFGPEEALRRWMERYVDFLATKRGLAGALHSGDPAYAALPAYFGQRLLPALQTLLGTASAAKAVRSDIDAEELLHAAANLCRGSRDRGLDHARKMVNLLVDGMCHKHS
jgi:AcrR family transcriptional regulator